MKSTIDLYQSVTDAIITALEAGTPPWVCPWNQVQGSLLPANLSTGRQYRGINTLLLNVQTMTQGYALNRWLTFQQARALGACVRRGETGSPIVFFKMLECDGTPRAANDTPARKVIPLLRSFTVFNAAQVDGLPEALTAVPAPPEDWSPIDAAETLMARSGAVIRHGGDRAFYRPGDDVIQLPLPAQFPQASSYYATALHELSHWTGHPTRCNRVLSGRQHIEAYAFEELVAEMGSAFLSSHCGLPGELQHASYIASWLTALSSDKRLIFRAASLAQKAADFLLPAQATEPNPQAKSATALA
ncbi:ArdC family protein [Rhodoferax sp. PAMC 29310]|uniref:ArdC family protein n=1 Tax=Rhodoferax sp. PAMC 29310 TaxID=2822760 RepID=UPI001B33033E|nr:zincin-like metallopeptidase domain-containing protein [Rhodoferax sp. PAMC 29310]